MTLSRRRFLQGTGAVIVSFSLNGGAAGQPATPPGAGPPPRPDQLDAWLAVSADGGVTVFTGKVELGTGVQTAMAQIVAEELDVAVARVTLVQGDTARTP